MTSDGERSRPDGDDETRSDASGVSSDPGTIRSLAVTTGDVLAALEANERRGRDAVLRVTPPFAGRMRARLHVAGGEGAYDGEVTPLHLDPEMFVTEDLPYPTVDETEDELRASETAYTPERHRARHAEAVERWRAAVRGALADTVSISFDGGAHDVDVRYLG